MIKGKVDEEFLLKAAILWRESQLGLPLNLEANQQHSKNLGSKEHKTGKKPWPGFWLTGRFIDLFTDLNKPVLFDFNNIVENTFITASYN